jgi:hypothetical protein
VDDRHRVLARGGGVALRRDFVAAGFDADGVIRAVRAGVLVRLRRGAYADAELWRSLDERGRHLLTARAVLAALSPPAALSHVSAALALGLPVWGVDLSTVHVTRAHAGQSRQEAGVVHHRGHLPPDQVVEVDGMRVTRADRTVLDIARLAGFESGVVTADAALYQSLVTVDDMVALHVAMADWPGSAVAGRVIRFADGLAQTVGESRTRVFCHVIGLPTPKLQVEVYARGHRYFLDLVIEEAMTAIEFDGKLKYRMGDSEDPRTLEAIMWAEKRREDDVRSIGYRFERVVWEDFARPRLTSARLWGTVRQGMADVSRGVVPRRRPA